MNIKLLSSVVALAVGGATFGGVAQAVTEASQTTTIEKSTTVVPQPAAKVEEQTTTTKSKKGIFGRKKSETSTTTSRYEDPSAVTNTEVKSRTTIETEKRY